VEERSFRIGGRNGPWALLCCFSAPAIFIWTGSSIYSSTIYLRFVGDSDILPAYLPFWVILRSFSGTRWKYLLFSPKYRVITLILRRLYFVLLQYWNMIRLHLRDSKSELLTVLGHRSTQLRMISDHSWVQISSPPRGFIVRLKPERSSYVAIQE
jgi:hypothetical protein